MTPSVTGSRQGQEREQLPQLRGDLVPERSDCCKLKSSRPHALQAKYPIASPQKAQWLISGLFIVVAILEYTTPPPFVFGYLYVGAVLLASARLSRRATIWVAGISVALTLLNLTQGYCVKGIPAKSLILAIRSVVAGASWWDRTATKEIQAAFQQESALPPAASQESENPLTKREQEILALIAAGKSNQEIATTLYIAPGTVRVHVHTILQKLEVRDRTQAAILAIQKGFVSDGLLNQH